MRDARFEMRDARFEMRDARCEMRDARCEMRDARCESVRFVICPISTVPRKHRVDRWRLID